MPRTRAAALAVAVAACGGAACGSSRPRQVPEPTTTAGYRATVRWTAYSVPHVIADDLGSLGFGQGWVSAKQHLCRLADQFVRVRGERARYFGAGAGNLHADSDFFHLHLGLTERAEDLLERMSSDARDVVRGWVAGYDHYVAHTPPDTWPEPCRNAEWVKPIDELDLARLDLGLATIASSRAFLADIAKAAPSAGTARGTSERPSPDTTWPSPDTTRPTPDTTWPSPDTAYASNGWALGGDATETGRGLLVANPHFPWEGDLTFSEIHLTVRGDLDVYGATIPGVPMVGIGFTRHHAWTHTFSSSARFLVYRLAPPAGITPRTYAIDVRNPDGSIAKHERTMYRSERGVMLASAQMPWTGDSAFALADVALDSAGSVVDLYLGFARAESLDAFRAATAHRATPFLNTLYADVDGNAWYIDGSAVPALSDEALAAWELGKKAVPALAEAWRHKIAIVDGSSDVFDLVTTDPEQPGVVPIEDAPELLRRDFVFNANDPYGWTNPAAPLDGASPFYGDPHASPSPRSLINLRMLRERGDAAAAGRGGLFTRQEAVAAMLSNRSFSGEQLRDLVYKTCRGAKEKKAYLHVCRDLATWDLRYDLDSRGAVLWRELMLQLAKNGEIPWRATFDPKDPSTPSGLALSETEILAALERATNAIEDAKVATNVRLGEVQRAAIGSRVPVPGGQALDGVANVAAWAEWNGTLLPRATRDAPLTPGGLGADGYAVNYGTSWVMAVDLERGGPNADVLLTYGPGDQLERFGRGQLRHALFEDEEIRADPELVVEEVSSGGTE